MSTSTYRPPEILHWFGAGSTDARSSAKRKGKAAAKSVSESEFKDTIVHAAGFAKDVGRGAFAEIAKKSADHAQYRFEDEYLEIQGAIATKKINYDDIEAIYAKSNDRFVIHTEESSTTIKPIAHLVTGRIRVPIGWIRNNIEVPYATIVEELSARAGVEIEPA